MLPSVQNGLHLVPDQPEPPQADAGSYVKEVPDMKMLGFLALGGFLAIAPAGAQDRLDRDIDQLRGYSTHGAESSYYGSNDGYDRYRGQRHSDRIGNDDDRYGRYDYGRYDQDRANSWGSSYRQEPRPLPGYDNGDRQLNRRSGIVREYRRGKDYCYYRGDPGNGWAC